MGFIVKLSYVKQTIKILILLLFFLSFHCCLAGPALTTQVHIFLALAQHISYVIELNLLD